MNCIIIGASKGIGRAISQRFTQAGYSTYLLARSEKILTELSKELQGENIFSHSYVCDISQNSQLQVVLNEIIGESGRVDVMINPSAILGELIEIHNYDIEEWKKVIDTNLNGAYYAMRHVLPHMISNKYGIVINFTSNLGKYPREKTGAYSVSKTGLDMLTSIADLESKNYSVRCFALNPGRVATEMRRQVAPDEDQSILTQPEDIADFCLKLCKRTDYLSLPCAIDYKEWKRKI